MDILPDNQPISQEDIILTPQGALAIVEADLETPFGLLEDIDLPAADAAVEATRQHNIATANAVRRVAGQASITGL